MSLAKITAILIWRVIGNFLEKDIHPHKLPAPTNYKPPWTHGFKLYEAYLQELVDSPVSLSQ